MKLQYFLQPTIVAFDDHVRSGNSFKYSNFHRLNSIIDLLFKINSVIMLIIFSGWCLLLWYHFMWNHCKSVCWPRSSTSYQCTYLMFYMSLSCLFCFVPLLLCYLFYNALAVSICVSTSDVWYFRCCFSCDLSSHTWFHLRAFYECIYILSFNIKNLEF
jgi:hypothetical protein